MPLTPPGQYRKTRGILRSGTRAAQPAATDVLEGTLYYVTDENVVERSNATVWESMTVGGDVAGGDGATSGLTLKSTTGNGTSRTDYVRAVLGNNGSIDAGRFINNGGAGFLLVNEAALKFTALASAKGGVEMHIETDSNFAVTPKINLPSSGVAFQAYNDTVSANVGFEFRGQPIGFTIGQAIFTQHFARSGQLTPAALSAGNNNDYNPSSFGGETPTGAYALRLTGDGGGTSVITGIAGGVNYGLGGREVLIINVSANNIGLAHEDANSTTANRIISPTAATITLAANDNAKLWYDSVSGRWRIVGVSQ